MFQVLNKTNPAMKNTIAIVVSLILIFSINSFGQSIELKKDQLEAVGSRMSIRKLDGRDVVQVVKDSSLTNANTPSFAKVKGYDLHDGTIEVSVLSRLLPNAPPQARGFIGVAFRINGDNSKFECFYLRPTNGRADDQVRRNHSIQYFSHPDYGFDRFRKEAPEKYESYADMGLNEWIKNDCCE